MKRTLAICLVGLVASSVWAGGVITEDFNGGVFTSATTSMTVEGVAGSLYYTANATADFDGWIAYEDGGTGNPINGEQVALDFVRAGLVPNSNCMPGWTTTDGNVGAFYQKQNDVPKSGWGASAILDASMGGARDASGNALAFTLIYDAELAYIHGSRGSVGKVNAQLTVDGTSYSANSGLFVKGDSSYIIDNGDGTFTGSNFTSDPSTDINVAGLATGVTLNTSDANADAAMRGLTTGVIEQTVANGATISALFLNNRYNEKGTGLNVQYMGMAVDNVKVAVLEAGDANGDCLVDNIDIGAVFGNYGVGTTWTQGDFNADDLVDNVDIGSVFGNYGLSYEADPGKADLVYDPATGNVTLDGAEAAGGVIANFVITDDEGGLVGAAAQTNPFLGAFFTNTEFQLSGSDPLTTGLATIEFAGLLPAGLTLAEVQDMLDSATYVGALGSGVQDFDIVPEPATMSLLGFGALALIRRKK